MANKSDKKIYRSASALAPRDRRGGKKTVFKLDSSAYSRAQDLERESLAAQQAQAASDEPDDLISPGIMRHLTAELPVEQILQGVEQRINEARELSKTHPVELGGHLTQTLELPIIGSDLTRAADSSYGVFVEIVDGTQNGRPQSETGTIYAKSIDAVVPGAGPLKAEPLSYLDFSTELQPAGGQILTLQHHFEPRDFALVEEESGAVDAPQQTEYPAPQDGGLPVRRVERIDSFRRALRVALLALGLLLFALLFIYGILSLTALNVVSIYDGGDAVKTVVTRAAPDAELLRDCGIDTLPADNLALRDFGAWARLDITRSWPVYVHCDGTVICLNVLDATVSEILGEAGVSLGPDDELSHAPDAALLQGETLSVYRVRYVEREAVEEIPWREVERRSPLLSDGKRQVMNAGQGRDGTAVRLYRDKYVDGELAQSLVVQEKITRYPTDVVTLVGDSTAPMSSVDGALFCDVAIADNAPESYERLMAGAVCTAYSFGKNIYGASGMTLFQGFVAVNPNVIPYGSLLYITSPSGQFTYGWAIAADVGTAMMDGRVDIDCYFDTYRESALFGKKHLNVYVVKQLTQDELEPFMAVPGMFRVRVPE